MTFLFIRLHPLPLERTDERRTSHVGDRIPLIIPIRTLSLSTVHKALAFDRPGSSFLLYSLTLASCSGFTLAPAAYSSCCRCPRDTMLWGYVYTFCAWLWNSYRYLKVLISSAWCAWVCLTPDGARYAASLLGHICSLIQHGNLAVLPRGEISKQNDTLGYRVNHIVSYVDVNNVKYGGTVRSMQHNSSLMWR